MNSSNDLSIVNVQPSSVELTSSNLNPGDSANTPFVLNFLDTYLRHIKAVKNHIDPLSDCIGLLAGTACCCIVFFVQAEENQRPATRHDVVYAEQERHRDQQELNDSFSLGYCLGNSLVDTVSITLGSTFCLFPSIYRSQCQPLLSTENVLAISAENINNTKLFDSCGCSL